MSTDPNELKRLQEDQKQAQTDLFGYLKGEIAFFSQNPGHNLLSTLVHVQVDEVSLNEDELLAFCSILLVGGSEATMQLFSHTVRLIIEYLGESGVVSDGDWGSVAVSSCYAVVDACLCARYGGQWPSDQARSRYHSLDLCCEP